jgi:hypothetical protein
MLFNQAEREAVSADLGYGNFHQDDIVINSIIF